MITPLVSEASKRKTFGLVRACLQVATVFFRLVLCRFANHLSLCSAQDKEMTGGEASICSHEKVLDFVALVPAGMGGQKESSRTVSRQQHKNYYFAS